jgi:hypothetical protein
MADDVRLDLIKYFREFQDKYTYFLLAGAGASVAFAVTQTKGEPLAWSHIPLGLALLAWAISFYCGCRRLAWVGSLMFANIEYLIIQAGENPEIGIHPQKMEAACAGIHRAMEDHQEHAQRLWDWQFRLLIIGAVLYVCWHVLEMYLRRVCGA